MQAFYPLLIFYNVFLSMAYAVLIICFARINRRIDAISEAAQAALGEDHAS